MSNGYKSFLELYYFIDVITINYIKRIDSHKGCNNIFKNKLALCKKKKKS